MTTTIDVRREDRPSDSGQVIEVDKPLVAPEDEPAAPPPVRDSAYYLG